MPSTFSRNISSQFGSTEVNFPYILAVTLFPPTLILILQPKWDLGQDEINLWDSLHHHLELKASRTKVVIQPQLLICFKWAEYGTIRLVQK